jgi:hypothetical protein
MLERAVSRSARKMLLPVALGAVLAAPGTKAAEYVFVPSLHCVGGPYGLDLPEDARQLRSLGTLLREETAEVEQWDGYTATRKTLFFDGLVLGVVEFSHAPTQVMVTHVEISRPEWNRLVPFKLGQSTDAVRTRLGPGAKGDVALERTYGSEADSVEFRSISGIVAHISYSCYSG